ncbi:hypothetical protein CCACVL1_27719 [Corchorus capsularis]|uniref:Uncharacterized protein n=1 Tax=Corchorus capsularis TaxID=210143 RepID=A0A1R3G9B6_COCAP|nr:hypothetical protein CCACVL1_27719 [Corchorus capsularis]
MEHVNTITNTSLIMKNPQRSAGGISVG